MHDAKQWQISGQVVWVYSYILIKKSNIALVLITDKTVVRAVFYLSSYKNLTYSFEWF
jgi:hypothetical protein